jgi:hypothetical protein
MFFARGIVAEPPNTRRPQVRREAQARRGSGGCEGDGADSPTRARPTRTSGAQGARSGSPKGILLRKIQ